MAILLVKEILIRERFCMTGHNFICLFHTKKQRPKKSYQRKKPRAVSILIILGKKGRTSIRLIESDENCRIIVRSKSRWHIGTRWNRSCLGAFMCSAIVVQQKQMQMEIFATTNALQSQP